MVQILKSKYVHVHLNVLNIFWIINVVFLLMDLNLLLVKALDVLDRRAVFPTTLRIMLMLDFDAILMSKEFSIDKLHLFYFVM